MSTANSRSNFPCGRIGRRQMLADCGMGFTGLALNALLQRDAPASEASASEASASETASGKLHASGIAPQAKSVIWFFMNGGTSHLESFDYKPEINRHAGKTIDGSPFGSAILESEFYRKNVRDFGGKPRGLMAQLYPLQVGFQRRGQSGLYVSAGGRM